MCVCVCASVFYSLSSYLTASIVNMYKTSSGAVLLPEQLSAQYLVHTSVQQSTWNISIKHPTEEEIGSELFEAKQKHNNNTTSSILKKTTK